MAMRSNLTEQPENVNEIIDLQKSAGSALLVIIEVGACRMEGWKFTILDCVARCWVGLVDFDSDGMGKSNPTLINECRESGSDFYFFQIWSCKIS
jgi:hypothetical protein